MCSFKLRLGTANLTSTGFTNSIPTRSRTRSYSTVAGAPSQTSGNRPAAVHLEELKGSSKSFASIALLGPEFVVENLNDPRSGLKAAYGGSSKGSCCADPARKLNFSRRLPHRKKKQL